MHLISNVSCATSDAEDRAESFHIEIDAPLKARILQLAEIVKRLNLNSVDEVCQDGTWCKLCLDGESLMGCDEAFEINTNNLELLPTIMADRSCSVELPLLHVTDTAFYFTALPKNGGDDVLLTTSFVDITELDTDDGAIIKDDVLVLWRYHNAS